VRWLRLLYAYPSSVTDELLEVVATEPAVCKYLDMPLQHAADAVLRAMRRERSGAALRALLARIRGAVPGIALRSSFIVGFPGETEEHFTETFEFLHELDISYLHVFTYSERDNTKALDIKPSVPPQVRHERNKALRNLSYMKMQYFTQQHQGQIRKVLFERNAKNNTMEGYSDNYIRVVTSYRPEWVNQVIDWKLG